MHFFFLSQDEERRKKEKEKKLTIEFKYARSRSVGRQHGMNARPQHILSVGQNRLAWEKKKKERMMTSKEEKVRKVNLKREVILKQCLKTDIYSFVLFDIIESADTEKSRIE